MTKMPCKNLKLAVPAGGCAALLCLPFVAVAAGYNYTEYREPQAIDMRVVGLNAGGTAAGFYETGPIVNGPDYFHGFVWQGGTFATLDVPGAANTFVTGIADDGTVVGYSQPTGSSLDARQNAFTWKNGVFTQNGAPGFLTALTAISGSGLAAGTKAPLKPTYVIAFSYRDHPLYPARLPVNAATIASINDSGMVVGSQTRYAPAYGASSFIGYEGHYTRLAPPPGTNVINLSAINNSNVVVGSTGTAGLIYAGGVYQFVTYPGANVTQLSDINDAGDITGYHGPSNNGLGFVLHAGTFIDIAPPNGQDTIPQRINASGAVAGDYQQSSNGGPAIFLAMPQ